MSRTIIQQVTSKKTLRDFLHVTKLIYDGCPQYVPDLEGDIRELFGKKKNEDADSSIIRGFVAYQDGKAVGRVAAIVNRKANKTWNNKVVRFSLIEFIDDYEVSKALIDAVAKWGKEMGMDTIQGPLGVTDFDKEGMLLEDFHLMGSMNTIYNHAYYPVHMEKMGLQKAADWVQIRVKVPHGVPEKYARVARFVKEKMGLRVRKVNDYDIAKGGYGRRIFELINKEYASLFGFSQLSTKQIDEFIDKYIKLIDKRLMTVVENEQDELVGVAITMGSLSNAMRKADGKLLPFGWYHLLKALKWQHEDNVEMLLIAVRKDLQGKGVNALFFDDLIPIYNKYGFDWAETGPQLEDNIRELSQWKVLDPQFVKRRRCYTHPI